MKTLLGRYILFLLLLVVTIPLQAARIGDLGDADMMDQVFRFFTFRDGSVRLAVMGGLLLGASCGLLGSFIVVRKMALMGDTISHAVLPGVALGFLWHLSKDPLAIFIGASIAGSLGALTVFVIRRTTHLKDDVAMGMVLAGFYGLGICLMTFIQGMNSGNFSGLDKFLFGQAAALSEEDIKLMVIVTVLSLLIVYLFYKELTLFSFDRSFAATLGIPIIWLDVVFMILLASAIVISLQAVGVVLVSAMLITPAATAYLLAQRFSHLVLISVGIGMLSGFLGAFLSFLGNRLPTGPFMVLSATFLFVIVLFLSPRHGLIPKGIRVRNQQQLARTENALKQFYHLIEDKELDEPMITVDQFAQKRDEAVYHAERMLNQLVKDGFAEWKSDEENLFAGKRKILLTSQGMNGASNIVRRHRLWELYLTQSAHYAEDHVHIDAERVEHILSQPALERLDRKLGFPEFDPHGKRIPRKDMISADGGVH